MSDNIEAVRDDDYERFANAYQCVLIAMLERALRRARLEPAQIQKVVSRFLFEFGNFQDQGWLKADGERVYPLLCFTRTFLNVDTDVRTLGKVNAPAPGYAFHEHAIGLVSEYFAGNADLQVETGSFGESPEP